MSVLEQFIEGKSPNEPAYAGLIESVDIDRAHEVIAEMNRQRPNLSLILTVVESKQEELSHIFIGSTREVPRDWRFYDQKKGPFHNAVNALKLEEPPTLEETVTEALDAYDNLTQKDRR